MKRIAGASPNERAALFEAAAAHKKLAPALIEKDFWVCWTLERLFGLPDLAPHLLFKGGTTLSKVYAVIERFSEDIDLSLSRDYLGFGQEQEPERAPSKTQQRKRIEALLEAFYAAVEQRVFPALDEAIREELGEGDWTLTRGAPGVLEFGYPASLSSGLAYVRRAVTIEMGGRNDTWPAEEHAITPYLGELIADLVPARVRVLGVERTFWEKATILHDEFFRPPEKVRGERLSRHYYDLFQLARHERIGVQALGRVDLLARVAAHKGFFYPSSWSRYDLARPGSLHLAPPGERWSELRRDYERMGDLFFGPAPSFEALMAFLGELESRINGSDESG